MNDSSNMTISGHAPRGSRFARQEDCVAAAQGDDRLACRAVARVKEGDMSALHFLYVRYADDVFAYVRSIVRDHHEAEDLTQTVFTKLPTALRRYEQRETPLGAWILRVARNAALDHVRAKRAVPCEEVRTSDDGHDQVGFERLQCLKEALAELPSDQREVLVLRHIAGLSPGEIARLLDKTEGSIHGLHHRGRGTMQVALDDLGAAPVTAIG